MDYKDHITIEPGKRGGKPCIRGMRMTFFYSTNPLMPVIQVSHLTKEYHLGAMQGLKQTLLNSTACLIDKKKPRIGD